MPSLQDIADQINARLDQIAHNTADTRTELTHVNSRLSQIDNTLAAGFANLSQGLFAILEVDRAAVHLLDHNRRQNDTMICELDAIKDLLCNIMRKLGHQLELSGESVRSSLRVEGIAERAHCCEAGDYDRNLEIIQRMKECCPPKPVPPERCPDDCKVPDFRERNPGGQEWKPLPNPQRPSPVG